MAEIPPSELRRPVVEVEIERTRLREQRAEIEAGIQAEREEYELFLQFKQHARLAEIEEQEARLERIKQLALDRIRAEAPWDDPEDDDTQPIAGNDDADSD